MGIKENVIRLRELESLTQEELAEIAGVSRSAVSLWESGQSEPRPSALDRITARFGIPRSWLIDDDGMTNTYIKGPNGAIGKIEGAAPEWGSPEWREKIQDIAGTLQSLSYYDLILIEELVERLSLIDPEYD